jgi:hypothetical protein
MRRRAVLIGLTVAAIAVGVGMWVSAAQRESRLMNSVYGSAAARAVVEDPQRVQVYRLDALADERAYPDQIADYPIASGPFDVPDETAAEIAEAILSPGSYDWGSEAKGCLPRFGVRVAFIRGTEQVDVLFCFECRILYVGHGGSLVGSGSFDHAPRNSWVP